VQQPAGRLGDGIERGRVGLSQNYNASPMRRSTLGVQSGKDDIMPIAKGTIQHNNWDEKPYHEAPPQKSTTAIVDIVFEGDLAGTGLSRTLMQYPDAETCHYAGYILVSGTLAGKSGTFMLFEQGLWSGGVARSSWQIVENSGTGDLETVTGTGSYAAQHDKTVHFELDYSL